MPYWQNELINIKTKIKIKRNNYNTLARSLDLFNKTSVGSNSLYSFCERAEKYNFDEYKQIKNQLKIPHYEVEEISKDLIQETIDIALTHGDHDFVAEGILTHNTNPCQIYCLSSNTLLDNLLVVAHATGHNDFFKNNIYFKNTQSESHNWLNTMANHGTKIRRYMSRWGKEKVTEFIDHVLRLETLVDPAKAWVKRHKKDNQLIDKRNYYEPRRINSSGHDYMEDWINPPEWKQKEKERIKKLEIAEELNLFKNPTRDILGYLRDNAPLKLWQADIVDMLYEEALYFAPQRMTKTINEGAASYVDFNIMAKQGYASLGQEKAGGGIIEYAKHKSGVLGGKYSSNPYKLGFSLLLDIEERWDKGKFGTEYENCKNMEERLNWDKKLNLGKEKVFEVRKYYDDVSLIREFFTPEFCNEKEFFEWEQRPNGDIVVVNKDFKSIKNKLISSRLNGGLPEIRLIDPNYRGRDIFLLEHIWEGRPLLENETKDCLASIFELWKKPVVLSSGVEDDEMVYVALGNKDEDVMVMSRQQFDNDKLF